MKRGLYHFFLTMVEILFFICILATSVSASDVIRLDLSNGSIAIDATSSGAQFTQGDTVYQNADGVAVIHQSDSETAIGNTISVNSGSVHLYVNDLNIDTAGARSAINIASGASLTLTVAGENIFRGGIRVPPNASLYIDGTGIINAYSSLYACIGGGYEESCGSITINGGTVNATTFGDEAAAIGGGEAGAGGIITINDGNVTANVESSFSSAAGIGGGCAADGGTIVINGGTVHTNVKGYGAGIGGGHYGNGGTITITNGTVSSVSRCGAGIGGGAGSSSTKGGAGGTITISGGNVTSISSFSAGIGSGYGLSGYGADAGTILISGGLVNATGGGNRDPAYKDGENYGGAGIGGGGNGSGGRITITGGEVIAQGGWAAAGIGGGTNAAIGIITIEDGSITASGGSGHIYRRTSAAGGAGIGGSYKSTGGTIIVKGGTVTANGGGKDSGIYYSGNFGSGIGRGGDGACDIITIQGGSIHAEGAIQNSGYSCYGAGIDATDVNIEDGEIYAEGGRDTPGIHGENVVLQGGTVEAVGRSGGAGINGAEITILGGDVTAQGSSGGAGIGGNDSQAGGHIEIAGGTVSAVGGSLASGIGGGGGYAGNGGEIVIRGGNINVVSGGSASAIGGGGCGTDYGTPGHGGTVEISGSAYVVAEGYYHAIGGGSPKNDYGCFSLTIAETAVVIPSQKQTAQNASVPFSDFQEKITFEGALEDATAVLNHDVQFTTLATGHSGVTYQWQESADGTTWTSISEQTSEVATIAVDKNRDGHRFRCEIANGFGNVVYTDEASVAVIYFVQQPQNTAPDSEGTVQFSVVASSDTVNYHWEKSTDMGTTWQAISGEADSRLDIVVGKTEGGALYHCVLTATNGDTLVSESAYVLYSLQFSQQPVNMISEIGQMVALTAKADTSYVIYQWQVRMSPEDEWLDIQGETYQTSYVQISAENRNAIYRCVLTAPDGQSLPSNVVSASAVTVSYDPNGGSGDMVVETVCRGWPITLPTCTYTAPARKVFGGWLLRETEYEAGESCTIYDNATIMAKWEDAPICIKGNVDEGILTYTIEYATARSMLLVARYDNGKLTDVQTTILSTDAIQNGSFTMGGSGNTYKLMLIDCETYQPLCEAWTN